MERLIYLRRFIPGRFLDIIINTALGQKFLLTVRFLFLVMLLLVTKNGGVERAEFHGGVG